MSNKYLPKGRLCAADGCHVPVKGTYSIFCFSHTNSNCRHGHPLQLAITLRDLRVYLAQTDAILKRNEVASKDDKVKLDAIDARWDLLVRTCSDLLTSPRAQEDWKRTAASLIVKLAEEVSARNVWRTVVAMYLMRRDQPRTFRSDRAFHFQLQRRVRTLGTINSGTYYDHKTGKTKKVFKDHPQKTLHQIGLWLEQTLGPVGIHFCHVLDREEETRKKAQEDFRAALASIE